MTLIGDAKIAAIVAVAEENNGIGFQGNIPWHCSEDLQHFKTLTKDGIILMGNNTFKSIGRPLPQRYNIVVSNHKSEKWYPYTYFISDINNALNAGLMLSNHCLRSELFVIGGASIYSQTLPYCSRIYKSVIKGTKLVVCDAFFPELNQKEWQLVKEEDKGLFILQIFERII